MAKPYIATIAFTSIAYRPNTGWANMYQFLTISWSAFVLKRFGMSRNFGCPLTLLWELSRSPTVSTIACLTSLSSPTVRPVLAKAAGWKSRSQSNSQTHMMLLEDCAITRMLTATEFSVALSTCCWESSLATFVCNSQYSWKFACCMLAFSLLSSFLDSQKKLSSIP